MLACSQHCHALRQIILGEGEGPREFVDMQQRSRKAQTKSLGKKMECGEKHRHEQQ
jgi:hypothetical protein